MAGFRKSGIFPFDPLAIQIEVPQVTPPERLSVTVALPVTQDRSNLLLLIQDTEERYTNPKVDSNKQKRARFVPPHVALITADEYYLKKREQEDNRRKKEDAKQKTNEEKCVQQKKKKSIPTPFTSTMTLTVNDSCSTSATDTAPEASTACENTISDNAPVGFIMICREITENKDDSKNNCIV